MIYLVKLFSYFQHLHRDGDSTVAGVPAVTHHAPAYPAAVWHLLIYPLGV
jgi:hypothetical protein